MKVWLSILFLSVFPYYGFCLEKDSLQTKSNQGASFNWGVQVGFNAILPVINTFVIDEIPVESSRVEYSVGHTAAVFCRLNLDRFFIQPGISWNRTESDIYFTVPEGVSPLKASLKRELNDQLNLKIHSLELPVMIGYNIVKEKPFGLSIMAGGKFKYNYKIRYKTNLDSFANEYTSDDTAYRVNLIGGIGVTLWQLFFDFTYEVGINHRETNFTRVVDNVPLPGNIVFDKRLNMMGFSLGLLF
ncbi:porin family protein [Massilibacteroides sp.]|uniref:porin family protein n=1 Tax=Massilibacteroides sp. TaxID=2034766 RepID=UPI002607E679|nr:porin family protein [Massilibacteroides sp.]MDD4516123.1 porin family protein [Massilibacteroides sp.]